MHVEQHWAVTLGDFFGNTGKAGVQALTAASLLLVWCLLFTSTPASSWDRPTSSLIPSSLRPGHFEVHVSLLITVASQTVLGVG